MRIHTRVIIIDKVPLAFTTRVIINIKDEFIPPSYFLYCI